MREKIDLDGYLERHYARRFARWEINDPLAKRVGAFCGPVPAEGIYQSSFGRDMRMPTVNLLIEARQGMRNLGMRLLHQAARRKEAPETNDEPQMELFA